MESEKPLPLAVFLGCVLTMMSLFLAFILGKTIFEQSIQPLASLVALIVLVAGIALMFIGSMKSSNVSLSFVCLVASYEVVSLRLI